MESAQPAEPRAPPHDRSGAELEISKNVPQDYTTMNGAKAFDEKHGSKEEVSNPPSAPSSSSNSVQRTIIYFEKNDPTNPYNWSTLKKSYCLLVPVSTVMNSTISSSLTAGITPSFSNYFHITEQAELVLPTSIFLVGYIVGPLLFGPLSESYGRRVVMFVAFALFTVFTLACAVAPTYASYIVFRLLAGIFASCPIAVLGGVCADIYADAVSRGRAMALFMAGTTFGPVLGPIIGGYLDPVGWRWAFWVALILAGVTTFVLAFIPETYGPLILKWKAQKLRKETGDPNILAPLELEEKSMMHIFTVVLTRPIRMICFEAIVLFSCLYLALVYAIFYIFLQSYPIIYINTYGFTMGEEGLTFLPIAIGACFACGLYLLYDGFLLRAQKQNKPWAHREEYRRLPLASIAGPFLVVAIFWVGWSARPDVHWIVPVLAGLPFGFGYLLIFMALLNYVVDAYEIFAASAMAASSTSRSMFGAVLPFATRPMYDKLGVAWACSVLGFLSLAMCVIPFVFISYGEQIRARSQFCQQLKRRKAEQEAEEQERYRVHDARQAEAGMRGIQRVKSSDAEIDTPELAV
ncbi:MFS general substrate transporter [Eremomyces bilateralis CBS 781.70]|uniref:MFS general substrate transporter n=1 Tax=Eremomyces bilateralis CBS 781.70 TaxID=1392243 RepID=A0A6G1G0T7_9PEZI|nr:MFS general substrate transporter [Eremomyces bilateralis CBS 781.70]KAF1811725.1 MFS general substrate transporter [Eremomyces bilateralis CBS 781.70]